MRKNNRKTPLDEKKVLAFSLFIFISAVLFGLIVQWIILQPAHAVYQHDYKSNDILESTMESYSIASDDRVIEVYRFKPRHRPVPIKELIPRLDGEAEYLGIIQTITDLYSNVDPDLVRAMIWHESRFQPNVHNGRCVGLMQISTKWHADRAEKLGITDFYDPYSNILLGVDYFNEVLTDCGDVGLALMIYNGDSRAYDLYSVGELSSYADGILTMMKDLKGGA